MICCASNKPNYCCVICNRIVCSKCGVKYIYKREGKEVDSEIMHRKCDKEIW